MPSAIPCIPLLFCIHSYLFSDWKRTVSSKFFDTQAPSISTEELVLPRHARCVLSRPCCNGHSLLLSSLSLQDWQNRESFLQHLWTPLISFCTVQLRTLCDACSLGLFVPVRPLVQTLRSCPASGTPWSCTITVFFSDID